MSGRYVPFQDYGPLTYQMPLAFMIPGTIQYLFGQGLTMGRYFAVLLSLFTLSGLFLTSRRLSNSWLAAGAIFVFVLSPAAAKMYSMALSEGLVTCLLIWVMFLTLGEGRRLWQLILGSILAGAILMIRIDLLPLVPLLCLYILWQHGWKSAVWSSLACLVPIFIVHALYWPNILRMWAYWLPPGLAPFLKAWRPPLGALPSWNPIIALTEKFKSLTQGIRFYYVALVGGLAALILWPRKSTWKSIAHFRIAVFLAILFFSMVALHIWAAFIQTNDTCVYCFPIYISFYACLGVLLVIVTITSWRTSLAQWRKLISGFAIFSLSSLLGYSLIPDKFIETVMKLPVPRFRSLHILPGTAELWRVVSNKFSLNLAVVSDIFSVIISVILGILLCGLFFLLGRYLPRLIKSIPSNTSSAAYALILLVIVGGVLSPTEWFGSGYHRYDCNANVLKADRSAGNAIKGAIEPQAKIFWRGVSPITLLYLPEARIYPAQLDGDYAYKLGGDMDALERYGWWDQALGLQWIRDADYVFVAQKYYDGWIKDTLESGGYQEILLSSAIYDSSSSTCSAAITPRIFKKLP
ncbi:MAG TPA: hypothetical protein VLD65_11655 [Anaerolineales bacterium]|nr:hypothetical protein [Anaerolineales bacterium]